MTREEAIYELERMKTWSKDLSDNEIEAIVIALKALSSSQEPYTDAISREDALMALTGEYTDSPIELLPKAIKRINALPPVTPQYTDAEIQKMQDLEFAEIQKAYEIGKAENIEVLNKIRAEIEAKCCITVGRENDGAITLHDVFEIIDKYRAESEE